MTDPHPVREANAVGSRGTAFHVEPAVLYDRLLRKFNMALGRAELPKDSDHARLLMTPR